MFPKAFMDALCVSGAMTLEAWIRLAATLDVEGLEFYGEFLDLQDRNGWSRYRSIAESEGLCIPMLCCSPDFCHKDAAYRRRQIDLQKRWIDMTAALGGQYCRILSGQRRPGIAVAEGIMLVSDAIHECLDYTSRHQVTLTLENHYKDNYWAYPEFAQHITVFSALVERVSHPNFGINFDPSNALLAGDDPMDWLRRFAPRVVTMHASDRYLAGGTLRALYARPPEAGYATVLKHGVIGQGLNDYDRIFSVIREASRCAWVSIEDGLQGMDELVQSTAFLRGHLNRYWPVP